jgi:hypothetical protein
MNKWQGRRLGVTVMPEYIQSEGIEAVLGNIRGRLGGTAVTTSPYVALETDAGRGLREPPADAGAGSQRLLDRPLWNKREVYMRTAPSFAPDAGLYANTSYAPEKPTDLTELHGRVIGDFITASNASGLKTYLQVMAAIPPCLRVQFGGPSPKDQPMMPNGAPVPARVDRNATLASQDVREYVRAMITDLCRNYPEVHGFKFDWPEYPPYHFMSLLADYNPQVEPYARSLGIDLDSLAKGVVEKVAGFRSLVRELHLSQAGGFKELLADLRNRDQVVDDHFRLRTHLVTDYALFLRECLDEASGGTKKLFLQGFPPPWNLLSGFDPVALSKISDELAIKFYTMHWPMIGANYVRYGSAAANLPERSVAAFFSRHFMGNGYEPPSSGKFCYPDPTEPHGVSKRRITEAFADFGVERAIGITHSYGPTDDVVERCSALLAATNYNLEINRYAYLAEDKIDALASLLNP